MGAQHPEPDGELRARLGNAIRECRRGMKVTQEQVEGRTGISQSSLSNYERGKAIPDVLQVLMIELACGRTPGYIGTQAGVITQAVTAAEAIALDPSIPDQARPGLLAGLLAVAHASTGDPSDSHKI